MRGAVLLLLLLAALAAAGCGLGAGDSKEGSVSLTVTRDFGTRRLGADSRGGIPGGETVMRLLQRKFDVETRYGGGFVQSIDGLAGAQSGGRGSDWFFYVNGIESPIGSTAYDLSGGDRVWWDYRDWTAAMRVPAVVGSWPEPFAHGFQGHHWSTTVDCKGTASVCGTVESELSSAGVTTTPSETSGIKVVVGQWNRLRTDRVAHLLGDQPSNSGVFAHFVGAGKPLLELLNQQGQPAGSIGKGGGLIAALREGDGPPTWVVTGTDEKGVAAAASLLGPGLRNHYAVATQPGAGPIGVPVQ